MRRTNNSYRRQRGATAVFVALALIPLLIATMLAIEVGRMYLAHRNLQKLANLAALDTARLMSGCNGATLPTQSDLNTTAGTSIANNGGARAVTSTTVEAGKILTDNQGLRYLSPVDTGDATAMSDAFGSRVTLTQKFPTLLSPFLSQPDGTMTVTATAQQPVAGSFYLGSGVLSLDNGMLNALLKGLLGGNVNLSLLDYQSLASVNVSLQALATAIGVDVKDLSDPVALSTQTPLLSTVLNGLVGALGGTVSSTVSGLLTNLADASAGNRNEIPLGHLLGTVDDVAASVPFVDLLDLILALGESAHADADGGATPIALPVSVGIPGVASLYTFIQILEPPQFSGLKRAGVAHAETAQVQVLVRLKINIVDNLTKVLNALLLGLVTIDAPPIALGINLDVAHAEANLDRLQCPSINTPSPVASLSAMPAVAILSLGTFSGDPAGAPALSKANALLTGVTIKVVGGLIAKVAVNLYLSGPVTANVGSGFYTALPSDVDQFTKTATDSTPIGATQKSYWLADGIPPETAASDNPQTVGSTNLLGGAMSSLFTSLSDNISATSPDGSANTKVCLLLVLCLPLGDILDAVLDPVLDVLGSVLTGVGGIVDIILDPLLNALGITVGSATVIMNTVSTTEPQIVSTTFHSAP